VLWYHLPFPPFFLSHGGPKYREEKGFSLLFPGARKHFQINGSIEVTSRLVRAQRSYPTEDYGGEVFAWSDRMLMYRNIKVIYLSGFVYLSHRVCLVCTEQITVVSQAAVAGNLDSLILSSRLDGSDLQVAGANLVGSTLKERALRPGSFFNLFALARTAQLFGDMFRPFLDARLDDDMERALDVARQLAARAEVSLPPPHLSASPFSKVPARATGLHAGAKGFVGVWPEGAPYSSPSSACTRGS
jgi:hypothetical protein